MVHSVREVYSGLLTYDMHYSVLTAGSFYKQGSEHLWKDMGLDVVGISAYFPLVDAPPLRVMTIEELEERWEHIFQEFMYPLQDRNPGRPILFLEFGYVDSAASPHSPSSKEFAPRSFSDTDENSVKSQEQFARLSYVRPFRQACLIAYHLLTTLNQAITAFYTLQSKIREESS